MWILYGGRDPTDASFIYGIMVHFGVMNLYSFLKCSPSDLKSLGSLQFDMRICCYNLCNDMRRYRSARGAVNASVQELKVCVW